VAERHDVQEKHLIGVRMKVRALWKGPTEVPRVDLIDAVDQPREQKKEPSETAPHQENPERPEGKQHRVHAENARDAEHVLERGDAEHEDRELSRTVHRWSPFET